MVFGICRGMQASLPTQPTLQLKSRQRSDIQAASLPLQVAFTALQWLLGMARYDLCQGTYQAHLA